MSIANAALDGFKNEAKMMLVALADIERVCPSPTFHPFGAEDRMIELLQYS